MSEIKLPREINISLINLSPKIDLQLSLNNSTKDKLSELFKGLQKLKLQNRLTYQEFVQLWERICDNNKCTQYTARRVFWGLYGSECFKTTHGSRFSR